jgi:drug/metabolite transporter (DMT)-like permease
MSDELLVSAEPHAARQTFGHWRRVAGVAFLAQGFAGVAQKGVSALDGEYRLYFLCLTYVVAAVLSYWLYRSRGSRLTPAGWFLGSLAGVTCVLSVYFLLAALRHVGGVIAFSVVPASALSLTLLAGCLVFKERMSRAQTLGILLALVGIVLVQL